MLHSGTAGAAMIAGSHGVTPLAASLHLDFEEDGTTRQGDTASTVVGEILPNIMTADTGSVFNLNVPNLPVVSPCSGCSGPPGYYCAYFCSPRLVYDVSSAGVHAGQVASPTRCPSVNWATMRGPVLALLSYTLT